MLKPLWQLIRSDYISRSKSPACTGCAFTASRSLDIVGPMAVDASANIQIRIDGSGAISSAQAISKAILQMSADLAQR
jgi:hypothetical protein